jgi:hypothetical protein
LKSRNFRVLQIYPPQKESRPEIPREKKQGVGGKQDFDDRVDSLSSFRVMGRISMLASSTSWIFKASLESEIREMRVKPSFLLLASV